MRKTIITITLTLLLISCGKTIENNKKSIDNYENISNIQLRQETINDGKLSSSGGIEISSGTAN